MGELERWSNIEESIWKQKSRIDWLQLGDSNTKFFHAYTKFRQNSNAIHRLVRVDGEVCLGQHMLKEEVLNFYKDLMGTAATELLMVDKKVVERGPKLNGQQQRLLIAECTTEEVREAIFSMESQQSTWH